MTRETLEAQLRRLPPADRAHLARVLLESLDDEAALQKSFQPKAGPPPPRDDDPRNPSVNFRGQRRANATDGSTTDPDARLAKKGAGKEAKLSYQASVLTENRHSLVVLTAVDSADGPRVELAQAEEMLQVGPRSDRPIGPVPQKAGASPEDGGITNLHFSATC